MRVILKSHFLFALLLVALGSYHGEAAAQGTPRIGLGFNTMLSTADGLGIGLRGRASAPINADLSLGIDMGATGFILQGRDNATWVFDPQVSAIITLPSRSRKAPYYLAGVGLYIEMSPDNKDPLGFDDSKNERVSGPTIHGGVGWVQLLRETTIFYEINPAMIIGKDQVHLAIPVRVGIIF